MTHAPRWAFPACMYSLASVAWCSTQSTNASTMSGIPCAFIHACVGPLAPPRQMASSVSRAASGVPGFFACRCRRMDAGVTSTLTREREVAGPLAVALAAGCRFAMAFAFGACLRLALAALVLFDLVFAGALLFDLVFAEALLFDFVFVEALLVGPAFAWCFGFLGLLGFLEVEAFPSPRGASGRAALADFCVVLRALAVEGRCTARWALAGAARWALGGSSCVLDVV
jgi:hypothetical protein